MPGEGYSIEDLDGEFVPKERPNRGPDRRDNVHGREVRHGGFVGNGVSTKTPRERRGGRAAVLIRPFVLVYILLGGEGLDPFGGEIGKSNSRFRREAYHPARQSQSPKACANHSRPHQGASALVLSFLEILPGLHPMY